uniref:chitin deacetylase n=1 Tax=Psilocybe cubensis TaxID=181762 RepID=A0A8H7XRL9_PSICU
MKFYTLAVFTALSFSSISAHSLNPRHNLYAKRQTGIPGSSANGPPAPPTATASSVLSSASVMPNPTTSSSSTANILPPVDSSSTSTSISASSTSSEKPTGPPPLATWTGVPPLESITLGMPTRPIPPVTATYAPGARPPIAGAPVLPTGLVQGSWPPTDQIPDTNSKEVRAWMKELDGFKIPDLAPTVDGSCGGDPAAAAAAAQRGWWTCGGYTRSTDIVSCPDKNTWGVRYVLDYLKQKNLTATFFVVGSRVVQHPAILIEEYMAGHEISVHTWSHSKPLTSLTNEQIVAELGWTRRVIKDVLGVTPTTMRPPWGDIDDRVRAISMAMGMVPIMWTATPTGNKFDTNDWMVAGGSVNGSESFKSFQSILTQASTLETGFIVLQHDLSELTVDLAVGYTLEAALSHVPRFNLEPIGQCQHFPKANLYLETNLNQTFPFRNQSAGGVDVSGDGTVDTKSGDGGSTAADVSKANADSPISAAVSTNIPLLSCLTVVVCAVMSILL